METIRIPFSARKTSIREEFFWNLGGRGVLIKPWLNTLLSQSTDEVNPVDEINR